MLSLNAENVYETLIKLWEHSINISLRMLKNLFENSLQFPLEPLVVQRHKSAQFNFASSSL